MPLLCNWYVRVYTCEGRQADGKNTSTPTQAHI
jgi:hypothetical protein